MSSLPILAAAASGAEAETIEPIDQSPLSGGAAFFIENRGRTDMVSRLIDHPDHRNWESSTCSPPDLSHAPVANGEILYRQLVHPFEMTIDKKEFTPAALRDATTLGLSVDRACLEGLEGALQRGLVRVADGKRSDTDERALVGIAKFRSEVIRGIQDSEGRQAFGVYDTAMTDNRSHADVCSLLRDKKAQRSARSKLRESVDSFHFCSN